MIIDIINNDISDSLKALQNLIYSKKELQTNQQNNKSICRLLLKLILLAILKPVLFKIQLRETCKYIFLN